MLSCFTPIPILFHSPPCSTLNPRAGFVGVFGTTTLNQTFIMDDLTRSAVIYARVSSENDRQDTTRQITDLQNYAIKEDIKIEKVFQEHISGVKKI